MNFLLSMFVVWIKEKLWKRGPLGKDYTNKKINMNLKCLM